MLDGGFLEPRVAALENRMSLMGSDLHAVQIAGVSVGGMIDSLSPATNKGQDIYGSGGAKFRHRWQVTLATVTADDGSTTYNLHIVPGSLWRDEGAGAVDLNVAPDGSTVTGAATATEWLVTGATSGSLYVVDNAAGATSGGVAYPLVYGNPTAETRRILLRVADLTLASSGNVLTQRQIGDALTGGGSGLQLGPMVREEGYNEGPYEADGTGERYAWYMGTWAFNESENAWTFAKAVKADGTQYPPAHTLPAGWGLFLRDATSARNEICLFPMPVDTNRRSAFLDRFTVRVSQGVTVSPPASDTDTGSVTEATRDLTFFSDDWSGGKPREDEIFSIQVAEANDATAYEQSN